MVCGLCSEATQKKLLLEADLTLARAVDLARSMEAAAQSTHSLKNGSDLAVGFAESQCRSSAAVGQPCYRCGKPGHTAMQCSFKEATCHNCGKKGHLARVCRGGKKPSKGPGVSRQANVVDKQTSEVEEFHSEDSISYTMHHLGNRASLPYKAVVQINQQLVEMEIDTGAAVSIISRENWRALFPRKSLSKASVTLRTYTAQPIALVRQVDVEVHYRSYKGILKLYVVEENGPTLLGQDWSAKIQLDRSSIKAVAASAPTLSQLVERYQALFEPGTGTMTQLSAHVSLKEQAEPRFCKPRPIPFAIRDWVGQKLDRLEESGVHRRVEHADWAAPIVPVPKKDGAITLCGDYKVTINPALLIDQYPLPKPADLMACLTGGKWFSKLDLTSAYQQMPLDTAS